MSSPELEEISLAVGRPLHKKLSMGDQFIGFDGTVYEYVKE
ncbi:MAG: hypothetical protein ACKOFQ_07125 [Candidatus Nanopelagicus sp.]